MKILVHIYPKFVSGTNQRLKGVPRLDTFSGTCLQAHIAFADALPGTQVSWIVVQENFRMGKHHQQGFFLGQRQSFALIQLVVAALVPEEEIKGRAQRESLCRTGIVSVG